MKDRRLAPGSMLVEMPIHARQAVHAFVASVVYDLLALSPTDRFSIGLG